jgi:hypothetical protein
VSNGKTYLSDEHEEDEEETEPRTVDTGDSLEGNLIESVTMVLPRAAEANVSKADGAPGEESGKTRKRKQPVEDLLTSGSQVHVPKKTECKDGDGGPQRSASTVDVVEELWRVTLLSECGEGSRATVDTRIADGDN